MIMQSQSSKKLQSEIIEKYLYSGTLLNRVNCLLSFGEGGYLTRGGSNLEGNSNNP